MCQMDVLSSSEFLLFLLRLSGHGGPRHWVGSPRPLSLSLLFTPGTHQHLIFDNHQTCLLTHSEHPLLGHPMTADHPRAAIESPGLSWNHSFSAFCPHIQEFWLGRGQLCLEVGGPSLTSVGLLRDGFALAPGFFLPPPTRISEFETQNFPFLTS